MAEHSAGSFHGLEQHPWARPLTWGEVEAKGVQEAREEGHAQLPPGQQTPGFCDHIPTSGP